MTPTLTAPPLARIVDAMRDPCFELDTSEAAAVLSAADTARDRGYPFDPFTLALLDVLRRQLLATDDADAGEWDVCDFEADDPHDDASDTEQYAPDGAAGRAAAYFRGREVG